MEQLFLPVESHFRNKNPWTSSTKRLRFRVIPTITKDENGEDKSFLTAEVWEGPWAYEFSTIEETQVFPLADEGFEALRLWLEQWAATINSRPLRSMAEDDQRRHEPQS